VSEMYEQFGTLHMLISLQTHTKCMGRESKAAKCVERSALGSIARNVI
jgi:hypothetical protein